MNKKEYLIQIQKSIELLSEKKFDGDLQVLHKMVGFRKGHSTPEIDSLRDIFYFLNGILFARGLSDYWNGREKK